MDDQLASLIEDLEAAQPRIRKLDDYYHGRSPLCFLSERDKQALKRFDRVSANVCEPAVISIQERLIPTGFNGNRNLWDLWVASGLRQQSTIAHQDALRFGHAQSYVITWVVNGKPTASVESPRLVQVQRDPGTREITAAVKRWRTKTSTEAMLFLPDRVEHWTAKSPGAVSGFNLVEVFDNPLGVVPVTPIGHEHDTSVLANLLTLQDAINKLLLDAMIASEYSGRPRRTATAITPVEKPQLDSNGDPVLDGNGQTVMETVNPFPESNSMMISANPQTTFSQLAATDLAAFESGVRIFMAMIEMSSGMPPHYLGQLAAAAQPTSADSLRASEAALVSRVEARMASYTPSWENVMKLLVAMRDGGSPDDVSVQMQWRPAESRSEAQVAASVTQLYTAGVLPLTAAWRKLGYDDDTIAEMRAAKRADALDRQAVDLNSLTKPDTGE